MRCPGRQQLHTGEQGPVAEDVLEGEVLEEVRRAHGRCEPVVLQQGLDLRAEQHDRTDLGVVQRLDPVTVAGKKQLAAFAVPDREREHPVEALDTGRTPRGVCGEHDLGVGVGDEAAALPSQLLAELAVVVELAVVGDDVVTGGVHHRLVALRAGIDDRQAAVGEPHRSVGELPFAVGAPVGDHVAHAPQQREGNRCAGTVQRTGDAAHARGPTPWPAPSRPPSPGRAQTATGGAP